MATSREGSKPNPKTLIDICSQYGVAASEAVYVGDSLTRDVLMAERAGVISAWAKFGSSYDPQLWSQLVRVTHWTEQDVEREKSLKDEARGVEPDYVLDRFDDLIRLLEFSKIKERKASAEEAR